MYDTEDSGCKVDIGYKANEYEFLLFRCPCHIFTTKSVEVKIRLYCQISFGGGFSTVRQGWGTMHGGLQLSSHSYGSK